MPTYLVTSYDIVVLSSSSVLFGCSMVYHCTTIPKHKPKARQDSPQNVLKGTPASLAQSKQRQRPKSI